jgi:hypothetical protein
MVVPYRSGDDDRGHFCGRSLLGSWIALQNPRDRRGGHFPADHRRLCPDYAAEMKCPTTPYLTENIKRTMFSIRS